MTVHLLIGLLLESAVVASQSVPHGPFMSLQSTEQPRLLAPALLQTPRPEYNGSFSPDGKRFYYTSDTPERGIVAFTQMNADGSWSAPQVADFSGIHSDYDPMFAADGSRLYFTSRRPLLGPTDAQSRLWYVDWPPSAQAKPVPLELSEREEFYTSTTDQGVIYFNTWSDGRIYRAEPTADGSYEVVPAAEEINGLGRVGDPFVAADESYLLLSGYGADGMGSADLYVSFRTDHGWSEPINLGEPINSAAREVCPAVTADGKHLIFASNRLRQPYASTPGGSLDEVNAKFASGDNGEYNIYVVSTAFLDRLRPN